MLLLLVVCSSIVRGAIAGFVAMELGELVRLKRSFQPTPDEKEYKFGVVVGIVRSNPETFQAPPIEIDKDEASINEIVVHLYDPDTSTTYTDEVGTEVMYSFYPDEIEPISQ
ncbi:MAG: hypothetical protein ACFE0J_02755 [Elainellaceae cyanobacterium]